MKTIQEIMDEKKKLCKAKLNSNCIDCDWMGILLHAEQLQSALTTSKDENTRLREALEEVMRQIDLGNGVTAYNLAKQALKPEQEGTEPCQ